MKIQANILLLSAISLYFYGGYSQTVPTINCGNGRIDPGEECDPLADGAAPECCTSTCQYAAESQSCFLGTGICRLGRCQTRSSQCANLGQTTFTFSNPQDNISGVTGSWSACYVKPTPNEPSIDQLLNSNNETSQFSLIDQLLPSPLTAMTKCHRECEGTALETGNKYCADFRNFGNYQPSELNYLSCGVDKTIGINLNEFRNTNGNRNYEENIMSPGVCITGVCRDDLCADTRCNKRGKCVLSNDVRVAVDSALSIDSNYPTSKTYGIVSCACEEGWGGAHCDIPTANITDFPGDETGSARDECDEFADRQVQEAVLISVLTTAGAAVLLFLLLLLCLRCLYGKYRGENDEVGFLGVRKTKVSKSDTENVSITQKSDYVERSSLERPLSSLKDLEGLPTVPFLDKIDLEEKEIRDRTSSISSSSQQSSLRRDGMASNAVVTLPTDTEGKKKDNLKAIDEEDMDAIDEEEKDDSHKESSVSPSSVNASNSDILMPANYLRAAYSYSARLADEIHLVQGDILYLIKAYDDGWAKAYNLRSGREGIFPLSFTKRIVLKDASDSIKNFAKEGIFSEESEADNSDKQGSK